MKSFIQNFRAKRFVKAFVRTGAGVSRSPATAGHVLKPGKMPSGSLEAHEFPIGTVRNGRMKVSAHPSRWVDTSSGQSFNDHKTEDKQSIEHHMQLTDLFHRMMGKFKQHMGSEHASKAEGLLRDFLEHKMAAKNLMRTTNMSIKENKGVVTPANQRSYFAAQDRAETAKLKLIKFVNQTKRNAAESKN